VQIVANTFNLRTQQNKATIRVLHAKQGAAVLSGAISEQTTTPLVLDILTKNNTLRVLNKAN